jgi:hypothetical protein
MTGASPQYMRNFSFIAYTIGIKEESRFLHLLSHNKFCREKNRNEGYSFAVTHSYPTHLKPASSGHHPCLSGPSPESSFQKYTSLSPFEHPMRKHIIGRKEVLKTTSYFLATGVFFFQK